jgi:protein-tyrosine-phosphatase
LPTGGKHRAELAQERWDDVIAEVKKEWAKELKPRTDERDREVFDVGQGRVGELADRIKKRIEEKKWPELLKKPETWKELTQVADDWGKGKEATGIAPGKYQELVDLLLDYRKAVEDVKNAAQQAAWKGTIARLKEFLKGKDWEVPDPNSSSKRSQDRKSAERSSASFNPRETSLQRPEFRRWDRWSVLSRSPGRRAPRASPA